MGVGGVQISKYKGEKNSEVMKGTNLILITFSKGCFLQFVFVLIFVSFKKIYFRLKMKTVYLPTLLFDYINL